MTIFCKSNIIRVDILLSIFCIRYFAFGIFSYNQFESGFVISILRTTAQNEKLLKRYILRASKCLKPIPLQYPFSFFNKSSFKILYPHLSYFHSFIIAPDENLLIRSKYRAPFSIETYECNVKN